MTKQQGPLDDIRIVELGHVIVGPLSATLMADFGADVIKVENPRAPDMMRELGPKAVQDGMGVWWKTIARNKRILSLDWKADEGRAAEAMAGMPHLTGYEDGPPMHPGFPTADSTTGLMGALGVMMALHTRGQNGVRGQVVDLAVFEALMRLMDYHVPALTGAKLSPKRNGLRQPMDFSPCGMFRTSDGTWVTVSAASPQTAQRLLRAASGDALADDPRFADMPSITKNIEAFFDALNAFVTQNDLTTVEAAFSKSDAVAAPVLSVEDILAHPQINHRSDIAEVEGEETQVIATVPKLSKTPGAMRWLGRGTNADSQMILQELGLTAVDIETLAAQGIIGLPRGKNDLSLH